MESKGEKAVVSGLLQGLSVTGQWALGFSYMLEKKEESRKTYIA